jgi:threonine dehydratase
MLRVVRYHFGMSTQSFPTAEGVAAASLSIDPAFLTTPLMRTDRADDILGCKLWVKVETLNPIRCFKGRGASWWMANLPDGPSLIVSASAGNFGQALAYAAARRGQRVVVFAATSANPSKIEAMRRLGAQVVLEGQDFDAAKFAAQRFASANGHLFIEDGADRFIAEGAGTIAKEMTETLEQVGVTLDAALIPLGNGALLTGMGTWLRAASPACRVIGVVAEGAPAMKLSWERDRVEATPHVATIADGIAIREPLAYALQSMKGTVDDVLAVSDSAITQAMAFCQDHYGVVVEPAGAAGLAAMLTKREAFADLRIATVLCGSNVAPTQ